MLGFEAQPNLQTIHWLCTQKAVGTMKLCPPYSPFRIFLYFFQKFILFYDFLRDLCVSAVEF
jgi:hypothetical protein